MSPKRECPKVWTVTRSADNVAGASALLDLFDKSKSDTPFTPYEVGVRYSNGNEIRGQFNDKKSAVAFLRKVR